MIRCACGAEATAGDAYCQACGAPLAGLPPRSQVTDQPDPGEPPSAFVHGAREAVESSSQTADHCLVCGAPVQPGWQFCGECGTLAGRAPIDGPGPPLAPDQVPSCARCGELLEPDSAFCGGCGTPVVVAEAATQASGSVPVDPPTTAEASAPADHPRSTRRFRGIIIAATAVLVLTGAAVVIATLVLPELRVSAQDQADVLPSAEATNGSETQNSTPEVTSSPSPVGTTEEPSAEPTTTPAAPEPSAVSIPAGFQSCGPTAAGEMVFGNEVTSCPFALNVADAWAQSAGSTLLRGVLSPVTGQTYDMRCRGADPVRCQGGNDAAVLIYP